MAESPPVGRSRLDGASAPHIRALSFDSPTNWDPGTHPVCPAKNRDASSLINARSATLTLSEWGASMRVLVLGAVLAGRCSMTNKTARKSYAACANHPNEGLEDRRT